MRPLQFAFESLPIAIEELGRTVSAESPSAAENESVDPREQEIEGAVEFVSIRTCPSTTNETLLFETEIAEEELLLIERSDRVAVITESRIDTQKDEDAPVIVRLATDGKVVPLQFTVCPTTVTLERERLHVSIAGLKKSAVEQGYRRLAQAQFRH
jgi:hypothetical protein